MFCCNLSVKTVVILRQLSNTAYNLFQVTLWKIHIHIARSLSFIRILLSNYPSEQSEVWQQLTLSRVLLTVSVSLWVIIETNNQLFIFSSNPDNSLIDTSFSGNCNESITHLVRVYAKTILRALCNYIDISVFIWW